jgi:ABC-type sugar transport system permease subunit
MMSDTTNGMTQALSRPDMGFYNRYQRKIAPYAFVAPFFLLFTIFFIGPVIFGIYTSFTEWSGLGWPKWTGLKNYAFMLTIDDVFRQAFINSIYYVLGNQILVIPVGLFAAVALNSRLIRFKDFFRTVYFLPVLTTAVVVSIVFGLLYSKDYGLLNYIIRAFGFYPLDWVGDPNLAKVSVIIAIVWRQFGFTMVFFLAGLQSIPQEITEASMVDGANRTQVFWHITLPLLRPIILFVLITGTIGAFQIFEEPFLITNGGPENASISLAQYLYTQGFSYGRMSYASTIGVALFIIIFVLSFIQIRWLGALRDE